MFVDREDAGNQLAARLMRFKGSDICVLALPRGGVPVAGVVARALEAPLDLVLVRKIGAPFQPELAVAAVVDGEHSELVVNEEIVASNEVSNDYLEQARARELREIERRRALYLQGRAHLDVGGRTAIIVDDGIATGATIRAAIRATRRANPKRIILAVPVAPTEVVAALRREADEVVCLEEHDLFGAIGWYYANFEQVEDDEVRSILSASAGIASTPRP